MNEILDPDTSSNLHCRIADLEKKLKEKLHRVRRLVEFLEETQKYDTIEEMREDIEDRIWWIKTVILEQQ